jgi:hypothetical protein
MRYCHTADHHKPSPCYYPLASTTSKQFCKIKNQSSIFLVKGKTGFGHTRARGVNERRKIWKVIAVAGYAAGGKCAEMGLRV